MHLWGLGRPIQQPPRLLRPCCTRALGLPFFPPLDPVGEASPSPPVSPGSIPASQSCSPPPRSNPCARLFIPVRFADRSQPQRRCPLPQACPASQPQALDLPPSPGLSSTLPGQRGPDAPCEGLAGHLGPTPRGRGTGVRGQGAEQGPHQSGLGHEGLRIWFC